MGVFTVATALRKDDMQIPTSLTVGATRYTIKLEPPGKRLYGRINYWEHTIQIKPRSEAGQSLTFWHELTHAILHDMRHPLHTNERFVTEFSDRLHRAVQTARFG